MILMFCSKFGAQISDHDGVCMSCGCETINSKQKQEADNFKQTENNLRLIFGLIFIFVFVVTLVSTLFYYLY